MAKLIPALLVIVMLAGCVADQTRDNPHRDRFTDVDVEPYIYRHGDVGQEIAELFHTGSIREARMDYSGASRGLQPNSFYTVEIAKDPLQPTILTTVGYVRGIQEDRGDLYYYEIYNHLWLQIAFVGADGSLYRYDGEREEFLGRFELTAAVRTLFHPPNGYGYDALLQNRSIIKAHDNNVSNAGLRGRGTAHRTHQSAPPIVVFTLKRSGDLGDLSQRYTKARAEERWAEEADRLKRERFGSHGDGNYGGMRYKDGDPVDDNDSPLRPRYTK